MKAVAATSWNGLGATVIVYEWTAEEWKLRGRLMAKSGEKQVIVPMCIVGAGDNRHCVIAVPGPGMDDKYPEAWTKIATSQEWRGRTGAKICKTSTSTRSAAKGNRKERDTTV